jgi:hypothetical protein
LDRKIKESKNKLETINRKKIESVVLSEKEVGDERNITKTKTHGETLLVEKHPTVLG